MTAWLTNVPDVDVLEVVVLNVLEELVVEEDVGEGVVDVVGVGVGVGVLSTGGVVLVVGGGGGC